MNKVSEQRMKLRIEYSRETDLVFSDNIPAYADWIYYLHLQNNTEHDTFEEAFKAGIECAIEELIELKKLRVTDVSSLLKAEREATKEEIREWLIGEDFEGLAERL